MSKCQPALAVKMALIFTARSKILIAKSYSMSNLSINRGDLHCWSLIHCQYYMNNMCSILHHNTQECLILFTCVDVYLFTSSHLTVHFTICHQTQTCLGFNPTNQQHQNDNENICILHKHTSQCCFIFPDYNNNFLYI